MVEDIKAKKSQIQNSIDLSKVTKYLLEGERNVLHQMINQSNDLELDANVANSRYSKAIKWAITNALPRMDHEFQNLIQIMINHHHGNAKSAMDAYTKLPDELDIRVIHLLDIIFFLKDKIGWYESQGY